MLITYCLAESHKIPPFCRKIPSHMPFVAVILWHFIKPPLPAPSEAPSAKPAVCFQWACATHFKIWSSVSRLLSKWYTEAAHSHWMSQAHLTGFMNKCYLVRVYWQFLRVLCLFCLSLRLLSPSFFLPTVHLHFVCFSHTLSVSLAQIWNLSPSFSVLLRNTQNVWILMLPNAMNGRGLFCFCFSPTHLNTLTLSLLPASLSLCGLVRQLCSVGRVSESDLTSAVLLLSWLVCLTLVASGCESYVKYGAVTFFPSSADHETRLGCVCVSECVWRRVLCVHREEIVTDCRLNYSTLLYLMVNKTLQCQTITSQYFCCCRYIWGSF